MEDEELQQDLPQDLPPEQPSVPRPRWQVWLARIALAVFLAYLVMYYINVLKGGL